MLRDSLVGLIETMWLGAEVRLSRSQKTYRIGRPLCLENPRPEGAECSLAESDASPFHAEPEHSILSRMWELIDRACYCPIVYNSLEAFKDEMDFKR